MLWCPRYVLSVDNLFQVDATVKHKLYYILLQWSTNSTTFYYSEAQVCSFDYSEAQGTTTQQQLNHNDSNPNKTLHRDYLEHYLETQHFVLPYRWCYCPTTSGPTLTVPYGRAPTLPYSLTTGGVTVLLPLALRWLYPTDALLLYPTVWLQVVLLSYYLWPTLTVPYGRAPTLPYSLTTGGVTVLLPLALRWLYPTDALLLYPTVWLQVVLLSYYLWPYADCTLRTRSYSTLQSDYRWCYCPTTSGPTLTVPYGRAPTLPYSLTTGGVTVLLPLALRWLYPTDALLLYPTVWLQVVLLSYYLSPYADCTLRTRSYSTLQSDYRWR